MSRVFNFSAGPAMLPKEVLEEAAFEMLDYNGSGMSVMEMSHRSSLFEDILTTAQNDLRELLNIPDNYKILFLQGGASLQFSMIPMNLMKHKVADYIITGQWAKKAYEEALTYGTVNAIASSADDNFSYIPDCSNLPISEDADYVYICENNTIYGTKFHRLPNTKGKPLVADVSSCFLSEPMDISNYGIVYGGVQKNVGPAGVVIVIIREDLITENVLPYTPTMMKYHIHEKANSLYNTPPAYGIYICGKVFKWLKKRGGLEKVKQYNEEKANILYSFLDESNLFTGTARKDSRSLMNVPFITGNKDLDKKFIEEATKQGFVNLKGHRSVGVVIVIIREDLITENVLPYTPTMMKYHIHEKANSLYNTPPAYGIYICGKVFKWLKKRGGLEKVKQYNEEKANILYSFLDESNLFTGTARKDSRSLMNVPFITGNKDLDKKFIEEATKQGFVNLKGHRSVGGMRASIYNAMPMEGVASLVSFMKDFEKNN